MGPIVRAQDRAELGLDPPPDGLRLSAGLLSPGGEVDSGYTLVDGVRPSLNQTGALHSLEGLGEGCGADHRLAGEFALGKGVSMPEAEQNEPLTPAESDLLHPCVSSVAQELGYLHQQVPQPRIVCPPTIPQRFAS